MAAISIDAVARLALTNKLPIWRITVGQEKTPINKQDNESLSLDESIELLTSFLNEMSGESVIVKLYERVPKNRSQEENAPASFQVRVKLKNGIGAPNSNQYTNNNVDIDRILGFKDDLSRMQMELLRKEMEEKQFSPMARLMDKLVENDNFITAITGVLAKIVVTPAAPAPAVSQPPRRNRSEEEKLHLEESLITRLSMYDADAENILIKLVEHVEKHPELIASIKPIIGL